MFICARCKREVATEGLFCPFCGAAAPPAGGDGGDPFIGQTVAEKYFIHQLLGRGGMGKVYKATHLTLDRPVVLKVLDRSLLADPSIVQRFHREARAASRLNHPNSISVIDFGQAADGMLFIAMEYLSGRSLARIIVEEFPVDPTRIVKIGSQILAALTEAHSLGILHRDLKPENVMVESRRDEADFVKVLDFGIAKLNEPDGTGGPRLTQAGMVCGTPGYMSPEQARGTELDARSDLYAVGVVLYELITGKLPFEAETPMALVTKVLSEDPIPLSVRRPDLAIPPDLEALIMRALSPDPEGRPASAEEFRGELLACVVPEPRPVRQTPDPSTVLLDSKSTPAGVRKVPSGARARPPTPPTPASPSRVTPSRSAKPPTPRSGSSVEKKVIRSTPRGSSPQVMLTEPAWPATPPHNTPAAPPGDPSPAEAERRTASSGEIHVEIGTGRVQSSGPAAQRRRLLIVAASTTAAVLVGAVAIWSLTRGGAGPPAALNQPTRTATETSPSASTQTVTATVTPTSPLVPPPSQTTPNTSGAAEPRPPPAGSSPQAEPNPPSDGVAAKTEGGGAPRKRAPAILVVKDALGSLKVPSASSGQGILVVTATPWANVSINGRAIGETPREVLVVEGTYRVQVTHPALGSREKRITIAAGKRIPWNPTLSK